MLSDELYYDDKLVDLKAVAERLDVILPEGLDDRGLEAERAELKDFLAKCVPFLWLWASDRDDDEARVLARRIERRLR